jgi:uncharacterized membrane protein YbhN (UPF0104 family)
MGVLARVCRSPSALVLLLVGLVPLTLAAWFSVDTVDPDSGTDVAGLARLTFDDIGHLRWQFTALVIGLAVLHYLACAVAARAAAGVALPVGETLLVQLAAAAANRVTPAGLGGSALTARYFTRRGMETPAAIGAVAALVLLGGIANLLALVALVFLGSSLGLHGATHEIALLIRHIRSLLGPARSPWLWIVVAALVAVLLARSKQLRKWRLIVHPLEQLLHRPAALATLILASGSTTLILGFAFIATTRMVPGPTPTVGLGALLSAFMLGSAAGSAVPIPAGLGSSEAAFVAILTSFQVPAANAVEEVLIFRAITFWAPAVIGTVAIRHLFKCKAL